MHKSQKDKAESREVHHRGGDIRSSDEVSVMEMEQRGVIIQLDFDNNYRK